MIDSIYRDIRDFLKRKNISQQDLAEGTGLNIRTIKNYLESGRGQISTLEKILKYLSKYGWDYESYTPVPVYEEVSAGGGREVFGEEAQTIMVPENLKKKGNIALKVRGNSMEPSLVDGSIIGVDINQKVLKHGKIYVLWLPARGTVVKRAIVTEGGKILAKSDNMEYPDIVIDKDVHVVGKVVWSIQEY